MTQQGRGQKIFGFLLTPASPVLQYPQSSALLDNITQQGITMTPEIESIFARLSETRTKVISDIMDKEGCNLSLIHI